MTSTGADGKKNTRYDVHWCRWEEEHPVLIGLRDDTDEASYPRDLGPRDGGRP